MEYTIQKLGQLAGVSTRTLRYYDEIDILKPARINSSGYRIYGEAEVDRLQQILFYKELDLPLHQIKEIVTSQSFSPAEALREHREKLLNKREQLDRLILNVEQTIAANEGRITMKDIEKFEGFKKQMVEENEQKFGKEIREKYGDQAVDQSKKKVLNMTQSEHDNATKLAEEIHAILAKAFKKGDPAGDAAQKAAELHKKWLMLYWHEYSKEAHANLAQMYVDDERFTAYYDKEQPGTAAFLRDAIHIYTDSK
ncbi:MerR family transcriptional regulator [Fictibacillus norfolkensis]|uniref:MerR family transcriptional regulator n=1 Tax=Fictibacillus norfolkensis TaxID=2762233 RepID=A0ABR8SL10_9BACL|nr:MerR family transcriptional regulator [Fictibacillus norfolkensis]MBD7964039.1 MerR family transcriptional regulator [Fictibacillus norfolkensis]